MIDIGFYNNPDNWYLILQYDLIFGSLYSLVVGKLASSPIEGRFFTEECR